MAIRWLTVLGTLFGLTSATRADDFRDHLEKKTYTDAKGAKLNYRLLTPAPSGATKFALVVFLHGAGERGDDNTAQLVHGVREFVKNRSTYPCYLIAPQCPANSSWARIRRAEGGPKSDAGEATTPLRLTLELIDQMIKQEPIDTDRIYITGLSMGGFGTWHALALRPDFFAAAVPICGGADLSTAEKIKNVPVWVFHGDKDASVPVARSREMVEALKKAGGSPKYTEYPGVGHNSWDKAYADPELMKWLFAQKRK